ncbi:MAG TPA: hypothetical protein VM845_04210, partial [Burkholderiaceae bacterium]|nr:hypothetical protein [Burkholderiaceae bacterium]
MPVKTWLAAAATGALLWTGAVHAQTTDAPNPHTVDAHGWASGTVGGRGGRIIKVSNLNASGPGSYRAAIEAEGPRVVVFEVGGTIDMGGQQLKIVHPYLTIAGQTAPSPGITVIKAETVISTHDVVVQHLRFRPGEFGRPKKGGGDQDGISTVGRAFNVIVDHCSFSWATDENLSASGPRFSGATPDDWRRNTSHDITYSHNLIYEGLSNSVHEKGEHSKGSLIHDNARGNLLLRNVYVSNRERNALFKGGARGAMVNNLIFNPGRVAVHYNLWAQEWTGQAYQTGRLTLVGNVLRHGPDTTPGTALFTLRGHGDVELHLADNQAFDREGQAVPLTADASANAERRARIVPLAVPDLPPDVRPFAAGRVLRELPAAAGARPWDRDEVDARLLRELAAGRGKLIDSELEAG